MATAVSARSSWAERRGTCSPTRWAARCCWRIDCLEGDQGKATGTWRNSAEISLGSVPPHHPLTVEVAGDLADRLFHHPDPACPIAVKQRQNVAFQLAVEVFRVVARRAQVRIADSPAGDAVDAGLHPPAVQHA